LPIIRERLSFDLSHEPLVCPAQVLKFKILESVPGHGAQKDFFHSREAEAENRDQLLARLISQLGKDHVFHAYLRESYRPEANWVRTLKERQKNEKQKMSKFFVRPSRILSQPERVLLKPSLVVHSSGRSWKVRAWQGPERISTEWWAESPTSQINRDYYQVMTEENEKLWIFLDRNHQPSQAFLHGYFD
jgi:protein ImuB